MVYSIKRKWMKYFCLHSYLQYLSIFLGDFLGHVLLFYVFVPLKTSPDERSICPSQITPIPTPNTLNPIVVFPIEPTSTIHPPRTLNASTPLGKTRSTVPSMSSQAGVSIGKHLLSRVQLYPPKALPSFA